VLLNGARSRAKRKAIPFEISIDDIVIPDKCPVFGVAFIRGHSKWTYSLDRVVPERGYVKGNVAVISNEANRLKSYMGLQELERLVAYVKAHFT
jgi:hypothetical protein